LTTQPLKHVADIWFSNVDKKSVDGQVRVRLCNYTDVYYNDRIVAHMPFMEATATPDQVARFSLRAGDVLLTKDSETADDIGVSAHVAEDLPGVICGYHLALVRPRVGAVDGRYLHWALTATSSRGQLEVAATGVTRFGLRQDVVAGMLVPTPYLAAQVAIANYLDAETARINRALAVRQRQLAILEERRTTLLGDAMTGRLPGTAAILRAEPRPLRLFAHVDLGRARSPENAVGPSMARYLRAANVKNGHLDLASVAEMNFTPTEQRAYALRRGDVLVTEGAGSLAAVGANAAWDGELEGTVCFQNHLLRLRARDGHDSRFLAWWARFAYVTGLFASLATGAQILNLGAENVRALRVRMPSPTEQRSIASYLDDAIGAIEASREAIVRQVHLLLERRQAVITAAVSGHLEVSGTAA
jgi:type I restriction enzyme S subunit